MPVSPEAQASMDQLRKERMSVTDPVAPVVPPTPEPTPAPKAKKKPTTYAVYQTSDNGATLTRVAEAQEAATDIKAVDLATTNVESGSYVAIPTRSLKIHTVSSTSVPKRTIS